ncbi:Rpn family recombination-promoting nuclease/putative transposase [Bacillus sp. FJAT-47783]|uniref:Rpn family recombination-promoting nuclease/putative transposase n=1 Tax=Bacillus sp. FJAT-47783 TaxID=2922712 RepID=UPI001FAD05EC|nr:Rpn family recombination-promoting nuclease/putative transposase [Bacillus sp. FJAT-47783]
MNTPVDHDRLFKELIPTFFEEFMLLFFPKAYEHIDFQHLHFLSEEIFTDVTAGEKYRVDLLIQTKLKGEKGLIVVHIETQSYIQKSFNERMFLYFNRLYEKYRTKILPITIFSYDTIRDEPQSFFIQFPFLNVLHFQFLTIELKKQNWRHYIRSENPVASALLSKMGYTKNERIEVKKEFFKMLIRMELDPARQHLIIGFFETYLKLSEQEEEQMKNEVKKMNPKEGEKIMEIMTSYEKKGIKEGKVEIAKKMLMKGYDVETVKEITELSLEEIDEIKRRV